MERIYRIGIFKKTTEKIDESKATVAEYYEGNWDQLKQVIKGAAWTHLIFGDATVYSTKSSLKPYQKQSGYRLTDNFEGCDFLALDVDAGLSTEEAHKKLSNYKHIIAPTKQHQIFDKKGIKADRYRVIIDLEEPIVSKEQYAATWSKAQELLGNCGDLQTRDLARFWQPSKSILYNSDGPAFKVARDVSPSKTVDGEWETKNADINPLLRIKIANRIASEDNTKINLRCIIPGHEDHNPSAFINKLSNWYHCASCGRSDSCLKIMEELGISDNTNEFYTQQVEKAAVSSNKSRQEVEKFFAENMYTPDRIDNMVVKPVDWLVEGFVNRKGVTVMAADSGIGKTWLMLDMMLAATHETDWLGTYKVKPCSVLYIPYEEDADDLKLRIELLKEGYGNPPRRKGCGEYWLPLPHWAFSHNEFVGMIKRYCVANKISMIVIDTLRQASGDAEENSATEMSPILHHMRILADDIGGAVMVTHHTNKQSGYRGSSAIKGNTQGLLMLSETNTDDKYLLEVQKVKQGMSSKKISLWRTATQKQITWSVNQEPDEEREQSLGEFIERVKEQLDEEFSEAQFKKITKKHAQWTQLVNFGVLINTGKTNKKGNTVYVFADNTNLRISSIVAAESKELDKELTKVPDWEAFNGDLPDTPEGRRVTEINKGI